MVDSGETVEMNEADEDNGMKKRRRPHGNAS